MNLLAVIAIAAVVLSVAYVVYGRFLSRFLELDPKRPTPAVELRDDLDYVPIESKFLLSQHFSAIAAAGPITGPILAGAMFGWLPALLWILIGSIFIGSDPQGGFGLPDAVVSSAAAQLVPARR